MSLTHIHTLIQLQLQLVFVYWDFVWLLFVNASINPLFSEWFCNRRNDIMTREHSSADAAAAPAAHFCKLIDFCRIGSQGLSETIELLFENRIKVKAKIKR